MTDRFMLSRRQLLKTSAAGAALGLASSALPFRAAFAAVGHRRLHLCRPEGRLRLQPGACRRRGGAEEACEGITVVEEENVPETVDVQKTMESMINLDGATLVFPTSFGYFDPHMLAMAAKFPDVQFRHCGGLWTEGKHPMNTGSYFGYIGMGQYLNGVVAGHTTQDRRRSASSPPSRSRRCCSTSTPSCSARARSIRRSPAR